MTASVIILGNDANYSEEISNTEFFDYILEYQKDGVAFWKKYGIHHPFLHQQYPHGISKLGMKYHKVFASLGISSENADSISFVELLDVATTGVSGTSPKALYALVNENHLAYLKQVFLSAHPKIVVFSNGFKLYLKSIKQITNPLYAFKFLLDLKHNESTTIRETCFFLSYHFSHTEFCHCRPHLIKAIRPYISDTRNG